MAIGLLVVGLGLAVAEGLLVSLVVPASVVGMLAYGHAPGRSRIKDFLLLKNIAVATSLMALACVLVAASGSPSMASLGWAAGAVWLQVLAGAMLCDVDDAAADARRGTRTLPNVLGPQATWWLAEAITAAAGGVVVLAAANAYVPWQLAWLLAGLPLLAVAVLHLIRPERVRDLVDLLFPAAVIVAAY
jgi:4-hydroxybenzoate polyprenyltransferase